MRRINKNNSFNKKTCVGSKLLQATQERIQIKYS